ncbi:SAFB-like transcription modulator isoform X1 [Ambystoma mexicanum]|uniref:SAFB-like transcription modulator isoform X1 n=1 Tax=Ambystoma mexicanum TaxID=8296 RepID=UPI0037E836FC
MYRHIAVEDEGGDPDNMEVIPASDTPTKKITKVKGKNVDGDCDAAMEDDASAKEDELESADASDQEGSDDLRDLEESAENEEYENEDSAEEPELQEADDEENKDIAGSEDGTQEVSKPVPSDECVDDTEPAAHEDMETSKSVTEAEDDNISVTIQAEDAITLDCDGDDLLETGKNMKIADPEACQTRDDPGATVKESLGGKKPAGVKESYKGGKKKHDGAKGDSIKKEAREVSSKKGGSGDKDKDTGKKASSTGASGQAKSTSKDTKESKSSKDIKGSALGTSGSSTRNLWVSGLSKNTKAADLKNLFGKYGKVLVAKIVTSARSPGAKCYGIVTMSSSLDVPRCVSHLHRTELHGQQICVEKVKNDPSRNIKKEVERISSSRSSADKRSSGHDKRSSGVDKKPARGDKKPSSAGGDKKPSSAGGDKKPSSAGGDKKPSSAGGVKKPASAGGDKKPASAGGVKKPASAGGVKKPASAGGVKKPASAGGVKKPASAGGVKKPASAGGVKKPASAGGVKKPASAGGDHKAAAKTSRAQTSSKEEIKPEKESKDNLEKATKEQKKEGTTIDSKKREEGKRRSMWKNYLTETIIIPTSTVKGMPSPDDLLVIDETKRGRPRPIRRREREQIKYFPNKKFEFQGKKVMPYERVKAYRIREHLDRVDRLRRAVELRRRREMAEREHIMREQEIHAHLQREREHLEIERQKLERERIERERLERERIRIEQERRKEAERIARERAELRRQQEQLRFEQAKRNSLKRPRDVDQRLEDPFWTNNKKVALDTDTRFSRSSDFNSPQNRYSDFDHRGERRYADASSVPASFERREHFVAQSDPKKTISSARIEETGFEQYKKSFIYSRNKGSIPQRNVPDADRRAVVIDRDDRMNSTDGLGRHPRETGSSQRHPQNWKAEPAIAIQKLDRERTERSGRDTTASNARTVPISRSSTSAFASRDVDRGVVMMDRGSSGQHFDARHVDRHSWDVVGPRKEWHPPNTQTSAFSDARRMGESRSGVISQHPSNASSINRVQATANSLQRTSGSGFKAAFKSGLQRRF